MLSDPELMIRVIVATQARVNRASPLLPRVSSSQMTLYGPERVPESPRAMAGGFYSEIGAANQGLSESVLGAMSILPPAPDMGGTSGGRLSLNLLGHFELGEQTGINQISLIPKSKPTLE
jgi:hypothetical protein